MLRLAADENLNGNIVRGLQRRNPQIDIVRIQDTSLVGAEDPVVLEWTAREGRVLVTHDVATITRYANERLRAGKPMPGVIEISRFVQVAQAIEDLLLIAECSADGEWDGRILYLPL